MTTNSDPRLQDALPIIESFQEGQENAKGPGTMQMVDRDAETWNQHFTKEIPKQLEGIATCPNCASRLVGELSTRIVNQGLPYQGGPDNWTISAALHNATQGEFTLKNDGTFPISLSDRPRIANQTWEPKQEDHLFDADLKQFISPVITNLIAEGIPNPLDIPIGEEFNRAVAIREAQGMDRFTATTNVLAGGGALSAAAQAIGIRPGFPLVGAVENFTQGIAGPDVRRRAEGILEDRRRNGTPPFPSDPNSGSNATGKKNKTTTEVVQGRARGGEKAVFAHNFSAAERSEIANDILNDTPKVQEYIDSFRCKAGEDREECKSRMIARGKRFFGSK